jgi:hypothetical protein
MADSIIAFVFVLMTLIGGVLVFYFRARIASIWTRTNDKATADATIDGTTAPDSRVEPGFWGDASDPGRGDADAGGSDGSASGSSSSSD